MQWICWRSSRKAGELCLNGEVNASSSSPCLNSFPTQIQIQTGEEFMASLCWCPSALCPQKPSSPSPKPHHCACFTAQDCKADKSWLGMEYIKLTLSSGTAKNLDGSRHTKQPRTVGYKPTASFLHTSFLVVSLQIELRIMVPCQCGNERVHHC